jgi:chorismate mutase-like protein
VTAACHRTHVRVVACALTAAHLLLAGCAEPPIRTQAEQHKLDELLGLVKARLEFAAQAAREAWLSRRPIDEPGSEEGVVDAAVNRAFEYTLPPELVREFFLAQIEAAKQVQSMLYAQWQAQADSRPKVSNASPDRLRPRVEPLSAPLLESLAQAYPVIRSPGGRQFLEQRTQAMLTDLPGGAKTAALAVAPLWRLAD